MDALELIVPDWPAPKAVRSLATTRLGGVSEGVFASLNVAYHVGDSRDRVMHNREHLAAEAALPSQPLWMEQVHGTEIIDLSIQSPVSPADASMSVAAGRVCVVMTADCLPVLICDRDATCVAAIHAGWRGLIGGIIEQTISRLAKPGGELMAWLGPAIGSEAYQVDKAFRDRFVAADNADAPFFSADGNDHYRADLPALVRRRLENRGVEVFACGICTYTDARRFFSYRRDGECGRQASMIWLQP